VLRTKELSFALGPPLVEFSVKASALHDRPTDILWNGPALVEIVPEFYKRGREKFALITRPRSSARNNLRRAFLQRLRLRGYRRRGPLKKILNGDQYLLRKHKSDKRCWAYCAWRAGKSKLKLAPPWAELLLARMRPPWASTID
jgi:hypothetical protein